MADLEQAKHVFEAVVLTALSDGETHASEARFIADLGHLHPEFGQVAGLDKLAQAVAVRLHADGLEACLVRVAAGLRDRRYQELSFQLCARVMKADGVTQGEEALVLGTLQEKFGFTPADVRRLLADTTPLRF
jgi:hypothetical protein